MNSKKQDKQSFRVGIYISIFARRNNLVNSLEVQVDRCLNVLDSNFEVISVYKDECSKKVSFNERLGLQLLLADVRDRSLDFICITGFERLSPIEDEQKAVIELLSNYKTGILIASKPKLKSNLYQFARWQLGKNFNVSLEHLKTKLKEIEKISPFMWVEIDQTYLDKDIFGSLNG